MTTNNANNNSLGNNLKFLSRTLTSNELLGTPATPVELIPAPGAGKAVVVFDVTFVLFFNTTPYANVATPLIAYSSGSTAASFTSTAITATASATMGAAALSTVRVNQSVRYTSSGAFTGGDSTARIDVIYQIVDASL